MNPVAIILCRARRRLEDPRRRTKGAFARDRRGMPSLPEEVYSVCWCAVGAVFAESLGHGVPDRVMARVRSSLATAAGVPRDMKDTSAYDLMSHEELLAAFDSAIAAEEASP